jgi:Flp pilus assembly protein TadB
VSEKPRQQRGPWVYKRLPRRRSSAQRRRERLEMLVGFLGCFAAIAFVFALVAEVQGKPAWKEAIVLACFAIPLGLAYRALRKTPPS